MVPVIFVQATRLQTIGWQTIGLEMPKFKRAYLKGGGGGGRTGNGVSSGGRGGGGAS